MLKTRTKPDTEPSVTDFEAARERWAEIGAKHRELTERHEAMRLALSITSSAGDKRAPQHLRDQARPFLKLATKRRQKLIDQLADLEDEIEESNPVFQAAREDWERAQRSETNRIAIGLQDRHRGAVREIATALEALSRAVAAEQDIHEELRHQAPLPDSPNLPNMHGELLDAAVSEWGSTAWRWARRLQKLKILE